MGSTSVHVPRIPELGIPKDASDIPVKVELLLIVVPETYVESITKTPAPYIRAEPMPLSLDEVMPPLIVGIMPAPRVVGPVMEYPSTWMVGAIVPVRNDAKSSLNKPFEGTKLPPVAKGDGKLSDPVPSTTRLPPNS